jgi:hypothetical protein
VPDDVGKFCLAHTARNKVMAAYKRGDLTDERRAMMEAHAKFAIGVRANASSAAKQVSAG